MPKVRNFAEITPNLPFSEFNFYELYRETFEKSELGRMKKILPLHEMAESFGLVSKSMAPKRGRKSYMKNLDTMFTDAPCYESEMRYPTDQKLWECVEKGYELMCEASQKLGIHRPRTKYLDVAKANLTYRKQRKHTKGQTKKITRRLLDLLGKILRETRKMEREHESVKLFTDREKKTSLMRQQKRMAPAQLKLKSLNDNP